MDNNLIDEHDEAQKELEIQMEYIREIREINDKFYQETGR